MFYQDVIVKSPLFASAQRVNAIDLLEPVTRAAVLAILADAAAVGQPLLVFETYRSQQRQELLFHQGATQLKTVGVHHYGLAADLVKDVGGEPSWKGDFSFLGTLAKKHGLVWGGAWKGFVDACHVQRLAVTDQPKLFSGVGNWYPGPSYNPLNWL